MFIDKYDQDGIKTSSIAANTVQLDVQRVLSVNFVRLTSQPICCARAPHTHNADDDIRSIRDTGRALRPTVIG